MIPPCPHCGGELYENEPYFYCFDCGRTWNYYTLFPEAWPYQQESDSMQTIVSNHLICMHEFLSVAMCWTEDTTRRGELYSQSRSLRTMIDIGNKTTALGQFALVHWDNCVIQEN